MTAIGNRRGNGSSKATIPVAFFVVVLNAGLFQCAHAASSSDAVAASGSGALEEVIVTAQKRSENVQDVPIAITAISGDTLSSRDLSTITQVAGQTPNVTFNSTSPFAGTTQMFSAYIRGVGQNDFSFNVEPGVGVYVDGVYYARTVGTNVGLLDVDRIEVLKGPQGTLFGRNTIGGAVSIVTRDPGQDLSAKLEATFGSLNRTDYSAVISVPLVDGRLYSQLAVGSVHKDGYERRIPYPDANNYILDTGAFGAPFPPGGSDHQGNSNSRSARLKLLYTPTDNLRIIVAGDFARADEEEMPFTLLHISGDVPGSLGQLYNTCISFDVATLNSFGLGPICGPRAQAGTPLAGVNVDNDPFNNHLPYGPQYLTNNIDETYSQGNNQSHVHSSGAMATADWTINPAVSLKSITAYRELTSSFGGDQGGTPFNWVQAAFAINQHQFSQELQLNANLFQDRWKSVLGLYFFHEHGVHIDYVPIAAGLINIQDPTGNPTFDNKSTAIYTHNTIRVTDQLSLTAGLRFTSERKWFEGFQADINQFFPKLGFPASLFPDPNNLSVLYPIGIFRQNKSNTSVRAGAEFKFTPTVMAYASYSQGFRSGGWTTRLTSPPPDKLVAPSFGPETANTYEVGLKSELLNHRLRVNAAAFRTDYKRIQLTVQVGNSPVTENGGDARIQGVELEAEARVTDEFSLTGTYGYLNSKYTSLASGVTITLQDHLVDAPDTTFSVGGKYRFAMNNGAAVSLRVDYDYKGTTYLEAQNVSNPDPYPNALRQDGYGILDSSVTFTPNNSHWELQAGVHNITDKRYLMSGVDDWAGVGFIGGSYSPPRQWFATVRYH